MSRLAVAALAMAVAVSLASGSASAHRTWILPSSTVLSGEDPWVTLDAAVSNELFVFEYRALPLDDLSVTGPDGAAVPVENPFVGKFRSSFDLNLGTPGTYRVAIARGGLSARWRLDGKPGRWHGTRSELAAAIPRGAEEVQIWHYDNRTETFVTVGAPTPVGEVPDATGLAMVIVGHPNDLYAGETAELAFRMDGKPAAGLSVELVRGGRRHRADPGAITLTTDAQGLVRITWAEAGLYWIGAEIEGDDADADGAIRHARYSATLEVLPQ